MENASKALIIAGAILLAILIITLGIIIYNQASGALNNNAMDEVEIATFNSKFTQYEGEKVRGSHVNALLEQIVQHNLANQNDKSRQVTLSVDSGVSWGGTKPSGKITDLSAKALTGKMYNVSCDISDKSGLVTTVNIK